MTPPTPAFTVGQAGVADVQVDVGTLTAALAVLVGGFLLARFVRYLLSGIAERSGSRRITVKMAIPFVKFLIYGTVVYLIARPLLDLSGSQILAISGLFGAALGLGLQDLFVSLVGGLVIVFEKPYQVGDKVTVDDDYGEVTDIGLRRTTLTTPDDSTVVVPNHTLFTANVTNANDGAPAMLVVVDLAVARESDVERAMRVVEDVLVTSRYVYVDDDHPATVLVDDETYYRTIRGKAYVADLRDEFAFVSDVTRRSLRAFEEKGIETPAVRAVPPDTGTGE